MLKPNLCCCKSERYVEVEIIPRERIDGRLNGKEVVYVEARIGSK